MTRIKLAVDEVRDVLLDESSTDRAIDETIRNAERVSEEARQRYPGDAYILVEESGFAKLLQDNGRSVEALKRARAANPRDPFIAAKLASIATATGDPANARTILEEALESNQNDKGLNFQYAELLRTQTDTPRNELPYYYRRAFIKWDQNYESQFWYARFAYESNTPEQVTEAREVFRHLRDVPVAHEVRTKVRDFIGGPDTQMKFSGTVTRVEATHGFVSVDGSGDAVFFHETDVALGTWDRLSAGRRVTFYIGFSLRGPKATDVHLEGTGVQ